MPRSLVYFAAFTGMGTVFAVTLLIAALVTSHVLTHADGPDGMFGMVTAFIVQDE